jgi:hypothetical protein
MAAPVLTNKMAFYAFVQINGRDRLVKSPEKYVVEVSMQKWEVLIIRLIQISIIRIESVAPGL